MTEKRFDIYIVLFRFVEVRRWQQIDDQMTQEKFDKMMRIKGYVTLSGKDYSGKPTNIVLTDTNSSIPNHKDSFVRLIRLVKDKIILISNRVLTTNNVAVAAEHKIDIESYTFDKFAIDMTKAPYVPHHSIVEEEEATELLASIYKNRYDMPKILQSDTQIIWLGAKQGDLIRIIRLSEATGESMTYRVVI